MPHWTDKYSFVFGVPRDRNLGFVALIADEDAENLVDLSIPIVWQSGNWLRSPVQTIDLSVCGLTIVQHPVPQAAYLGLSGHVFFWAAGKTDEEYIRTPTGTPEEIGMMRSIRTISGKGYAVGMQRQVYRREGTNQWIDLSQSIRPKKESGIICSFEGIDGYDENEVYACGRDGEIWWFDNEWHQVDSPTNINLTNVKCAPDGYVYICGRTGILLKGRRNTWNVIQQDLVADDFWGIAWFGDRLYLSTMHLILELTDSGLAPVVFKGDFPTTCFHLAVASDESVMWSTGSKDLFSFDGSAWKRID